MGLFTRKTKEQKLEKARTRLDDTTRSLDTKQYEAQAERIFNLAEQFRALSDEELQTKTQQLKKRVNEGAKLDEILEEAYATVCAASTRVLNMTPYKVQIIGALSLNSGNVAEMRTGEGKTLTSTMPIYLNALSGMGVHVVTVNDYLASRDAHEMGELFTWLGLTVGLNGRGSTALEKRIAFKMDITYTTNSEIGFDYLRDNMVKTKEDKVLRGLNYAIIDECDSILIDEARTPLIISGGAVSTANLYQVADDFVRALKAEHFSIDTESKTVSLTTDGTKFAEQGFNIPNLYDVKHSALVRHIQNALKAHKIMLKDVDYMVNNGKIVIIDQSTGRALAGRAYSEGLHQAIEAKEGVKINPETKTIATITYQNFFRLYNKLAGMTGTAKTEEEEFLETYNMKVEVIPTNKTIARVDATDFIFGKQHAMHNALIAEVKELHEKGQPVLIGTRSVEASEILSQKLNEKGLEHVILNAKNNASESEIIKNAGQKGAITISTNMAGRGTDIKLADGVRELGGLAVIGCERHESRRIDNQLIGRAGRQGDPGYSRFYLSFEDELFVRYVGEKALRNANRMGENQFESRLLANMVESAQKRVEGVNYDQRKNVVKYDDVIRQQRDVMYRQRDAALFSEDLENVMKIMYNTVAKTAVDAFTISIDKENRIDGLKLIDAAIEKQLIDAGDLRLEDIANATPDEAIEIIRPILMKKYYAQVEKIGKDIFMNVERRILIDIIDRNWQDHIDTMTKLRAGIHLRSYAQRNPLEAYVSEGYKLFEDLKVKIAHEIAFAVQSVKIKEN